MTARPTAGDPARGPVVLILNPTARRARSTARGALVRALGHGRDLEVRTTRHGGDATGLAAAAVADGARVIVAAGGDGTVTQVAAALGGEGPPLLPFPLGNANVFARSLGWPADPTAAAEAVARTLAGEIHSRSVIPWEIETGSRSTIALMNLGVGIDARVVEWIEDRQRLKRRAGQLGFAAGLAVALPSAGRQRIEVRADGGAPVTGHSLIAALGRPWAWFGRRALDPLPAAAHDGTLHWLTIDGSVLGAARRSVRGVAGGSETRGAARHSLVITSSEPVPAQADGEPLGRSREIRAAPRAALTVVIPH